MTVSEIRNYYNKEERKDVTQTLSNFLNSENSKSEDAKDLLLYLDWIEKRFADFLTQ